MTTLVRFNNGSFTPGRFAPIREVAVMQNELSRLMNGLFEVNGPQTQSWVPALDAWETEQELVFAFDLPGIAQDAISVEVEDSTLTVSAERARSAEASGDGYQRFERRHGTFARTVALPQNVSEAEIKASYVDGVLEIRVPRAEAAKPRKIEIGVAGAPAPATIEGTTAAAPAAEH